MNIFLHELKRYRKSTIVWTVSLSAIIIVFMMMYPAFADNAEEVKKMLLGFPVELRKALSLSIELITSLVGFYAYIFVFITLAGAIQAMNMGVSVLSKEAHEKTVDFLLSKPITRTKVVTTKLLASVTCLIFTNIVYLTCAYLTSLSVSRDIIDNKVFLMISASLFFVQIVFMSLGLLVSVIMPKVKSSIFVATGTVFLFFIISMFGGVIGDELSKYFTPFKYFEADYIIINRSYETSFVITAIAVTLISILATYVIYIKKDIHAT